MLVAVPIGIAGALIAALLLGLIGAITNLFYYGRLSWSFTSPSLNHLGILAIGVPVVGGLVVGLMARYGSERIRGHGIPEALESILIHRSRIEPKVTVLKPVSAAISIGTGGPFGAEGPIIMTGGSLGSVVGQFLRTSGAERKTLLVAGAAAGMAATFNAPVAAVLIAVELLLFEWRPRSLLPVGAASITATVLRWQILGAGALFPISAPAPLGPAILGEALLLGVIAGIVATILTWAVYAFENLFQRLPVHWMWWPAIGGIAIGVGGLLDPRVLGVGYDTIGLLLVGGLGLAAVVLLLVVKGVIWSASLGSGTSGGVLAPLLMMGAATGTIVGMFLPGAPPDYWALIALGAILGGTMRVPFTGVIFALELTRDFGAIFPLLAACLAAEGVTVFTLRRSILTEKIARRRVHAAREYAVDPLELIPVRSVMYTDFVSATADQQISGVAKLARENAGRHVVFPVRDQWGSALGFVTREDIAVYVSEGGDTGRPVTDIMHPFRPALEPDQPARVGVAVLAESDRDSVAVISSDSPGKLVGVFTRESVFEAQVVAFQDEQERGRTLRISLPSYRWPRRELVPRSKLTDPDGSLPVGKDTRSPPGPT
ncbi:MAG: chloride channel protein [Thermoplasmata archaeon]